MAEGPRGGVDATRHGGRQGVPEAGERIREHVRHVEARSLHVVARRRCGEADVESLSSCLIEDAREVIGRGDGDDRPHPCVDEDAPGGRHLLASVLAGAHLEDAIVGYAGLARVGHHDGHLVVPTGRALVGDRHSSRHGQSIHASRSIERDGVIESGSQDGAGLTVESARSEDHEGLPGDTEATACALADDMHAHHRGGDDGDWHSDESADARSQRPPEAHDGASWQQLAKLLGLTQVVGQGANLRAMPQRRSMRLHLALAAGTLARSATRLSGRGGDGVHARGVVIHRVEPQAIEMLSRGRQCLLVTGTNGKTTTSHLLAQALGGDVAHNATGANMQSGVVTALADGDNPVAVLEVDELHFPAIAAAVRPRVVVLLNATRDQLDRSHEVARVAEGWRQSLATLDATVVANAADPHVVAATPPERAIWCDPGTRWHDDARTCPVCGQLLRWRDDSWNCACGFAMPEPAYWLEGDHLVDAAGGSHDLRLAIPGRVNQGNAVMAAAAAAAMGVDIDTALGRMRAVSEASGRFGRYDIGGRPARLILAKNPAGMVAALELVGDAPLILGINARGVDGRDTSWLYDVPFESLAGRVVGVTGERRDDLALRLHLAGVTPLVDADPHRLAAQLPAGELCLLGNYSNFVAWRRGVPWRT